jgi:uncharacterized protein YcaQ
MEEIALTHTQARRFLLVHQGLRPPRELEGKAGVLAHIRRMGCIQFDPLDIVGRNPDLVLQARVGDYEPGMLRELLYEDRQCVDGYDKMMSIYRVDDWPFFQRRRESALRRLGDSSQPATSILPQVRSAIEERGPSSSIDLDFDKDFDEKVDWSWAPTRIARAALESMYLWGELIVHHKVHTRKVYDFARRHIPEALLLAPDPNETEEQYHDWYVLRRIGSVGLLGGRAGDAWLGMPGIKSKERRAALARLLEDGRIVPVSVPGVQSPLFMRSRDRVTLDRATIADERPPHAVIMAPLDNLLWDRRLVEEIFGFHYRWEVYKPAAERRYGYYVLPILHGDRFVARFEPGRDKENGALIIKKWWWESGVTPSERMQSDLIHCFERFLGYLGADKLEIDSRTRERAGLDWLS